jgi:hypothetical protein
VGKPIVAVAVAFVLLNGETFAATTDRQPSAQFAVARLFAADSALPVQGPSDEATPTAIRRIQESPPVPQGTGFRSLLKDSGKDFLAFPRRRSTWVILGIGGAAAALAHPADSSVNAHFTSAEGHWFVAGKYIGSTYTQVGVALGLYTIGRFVVPAAEGGPKTNKWSHLGFDLMRAQILTQVYGACDQGLGAAGSSDG